MGTTVPASRRMTIIDHHLLFAESVAGAFEAEGYLVRRLDLRAAHGSLTAVLARALRTVPRIVLLELDLGAVGNGGGLIAPLAASGASVIVLTGCRDRVRWGECLSDGATTVLSKSCPLDEVRRTVRRVRDGLPAMAPHERRTLIAAAVRGREERHELRVRLERLTRREKEVLAALMDGTQVRDIARADVVSEATVRTQVKSVLAKLQMSSQLAAVSAAHQVGWHLPGHQPIDVSPLARARS